MHFICSVEAMGIKPIFPAKFDIIKVKKQIIKPEFKPFYGFMAFPINIGAGIIQKGTFQEFKNIYVCIMY